MVVLTTFTIVLLHVLLTRHRVVSFSAPRLTGNSDAPLSQGARQTEMFMNSLAGASLFRSIGGSVMKKRFGLAAVAASFIFLGLRFGDWAAPRAR